jgi:DNA/RNA endonuclease G (NUC1)
VANWVAYRLDSTRENDAANMAGMNDAANTLLRYYKCCVARNDLSPLVQATSSHFDSTFDAGHLAPFRTMMYSLTALRDANYYTNIARMRFNLNAGPWRALEAQIRVWAKAQEVFVIVGPMFTTPTKPTVVGAAPLEIPQPDKFFAIVVLKPAGGTVTKRFFVFPNDSTATGAFTKFEQVDLATFNAQFSAASLFDFKLP